MSTFGPVLSGRVRALTKKILQSNPVCLRDPTNECLSVSQQLVRAAKSAGMPAELLTMQLRYLDDDFVAINHVAALLDGVIVDLTFRQFDAAAKVPEIFESAEAWLDAVDATQGGKYEYPELVEHPLRA